MRRFVRIWAAVAIIAIALAATLPVTAEPISNGAFQNTWSYTDQPVASGQVNRTWMWGPAADSPALLEPYQESPNGKRTVQYFDKTRMEITHPDGDPSSIWYVTNGLLAKELITGQLQLGDNSFEAHEPAQINVAGDANDPNGPTYATFHGLMGFGATPNGWLLTQTVNRAGQIGSDTNLASFNVSAQDVGAPTQHTVASVFWAFMTSSGTVDDHGTTKTAALFQNPFYATGYPLTEPYWTTVLVGGVSKQVLVQVFERRVLTYTPSNPDGWKVEAGNVGQHYYTWRYSQLNTPTQTATETPTQTPTQTPTTSPTTNPDGSFGDGTFRVGSDIQAGTYHNTDSSQGCYWERLSGFGGTLDEIIANNFTFSADIVTIKPSDAGFHSDGCGTWMPDNSPLTSSPNANFGAGTFRVGRDIAPGLWRNSDSSQGCYWQRLSGFSGDMSEIIANGLDITQQTVHIGSGDVGFSSEDCGTWTRIGN